MYLIPNVQSQRHLGLLVISCFATHSPSAGHYSAEHILLLIHCVQRDICPKEAISFLFNTTKSKPTGSNDFLRVEHLIFSQQELVQLHYKTNASFVTGSAAAIKAIK